MQILLLPLYNLPRNSHLSPSRALISGTACLFCIILTVADIYGVRVDRDLRFRAVSGSPPSPVCLGYVSPTALIRVSPWSLWFRLPFMMMVMVVVGDKRGLEDVRALVTLFSLLRDMCRYMAIRAGNLQVSRLQIEGMAFARVWREGRRRGKERACVIQIGIDGEGDGVREREKYQ